MNKIILIALALLSLLTACAPTMYGVPQETWNQMSEPERIAAIQSYEREQQARRQAAAERARREALERERERARQVALERERQERLEAIHRGDGAYGELIRVRLQGGRIRIGDRHHRYEPLTFTIADGETRKIGVADLQGREVDLVVSYGGGSFSLEGVRFPYDRSWGRGRLYADTNTAGPLELRGVDVFIEVHDRSARFERERPRLVVIREAPPQSTKAQEPPKPPPPPMIRHQPSPPPVVVREQEPPKPPPLPQPAPTGLERPPRSLEVVLLAAELKVGDQRQPVEQATLRLAEGESRELPVKTAQERRTLTLLYRNGELIIDGTPARGREVVRLPFVKEWRTGKVYALTLKGRVPLEKVKLKVTGLAK